MSETTVRLVMQLMGVLFVAAWLAGRLGVWKGWYWRTRATPYGYLPLGILFIYYSFHSIVQSQYPGYYVAYQVGAGVLIAVGVWWMVRPPAWVKPAWVHWVERHPKRLYQAMAEAVRSGEAWEKHTESQKAVDAWARSLERKLPAARRGG